LSAAHFELTWAPVKAAAFAISTNSTSTEQHLLQNPFLSYLIHSSQCVYLPFVQITYCGRHVQRHLDTDSTSWFLITNNNNGLPVKAVLQVEQHSTNPA
jgi:hypothetical protein